MQMANKIRFMMMIGLNLPKDSDNSFINKIICIGSQGNIVFLLVRNERKNIVTGIVTFSSSLYLKSELKSVQ